MQRLVLLALVLFAPPACRLEAAGSTLEPSTPRSAAEAKLTTHSVKNSRTGGLLRQWTMLLEPGRPAVKHGVETIFYASGAKEWERAFDHGKPSGLWRRWYENGQLFSEALRGPSAVPTPQSFWYQNGKLRMQGPAIDGDRTGAWKLYREDGTLAEEGNYDHSLREGDWKIYADDGVAFTVQAYLHNVRVPASR